MRTRVVGAALVLVLATSSATLVGAPAWAMPPLVYTIEGGGTGTDLQPDHYIETHRIVSGTGGIGVEIRLTEQFSVEPEVLWVRRGARLSDVTVTDASGNVVTAHAYLTGDFTDVPLLARFEPPTENPFKPFALVGPRFGFKTAERLSTRGAMNQDYESSRMDSFDFGVVAGGGVEYGSGAHRLVFDLRYDAGITHHNDGGGNPFRTDAVFLMAGYVFHPGNN